MGVGEGVASAVGPAFWAVEVGLGLGVEVAVLVGRGGLGSRVSVGSGVDLGAIILDAVGAGAVVDSGIAVTVIILGVIVGG